MIISIKNTSKRDNVGFIPHKENFTFYLKPQQSIEFDCDSSPMMCYLEQEWKDLEIKQLDKFSPKFGWIIQCKDENIINLINTSDKDIEYIPYKQNFSETIKARDTLQFETSCPNETMYYMCQAIEGLEVRVDDFLYEWEENGAGNFAAVEKNHPNYVKIGNGQQLSNAVSMAKNYEYMVIILDADITSNERYVETGDYNLFIDLNGHTITQTDNIQIKTNGYVIFTSSNGMGTYVSDAYQTFVNALAIVCASNIKFIQKEWGYIPSLPYAQKKGYSLIQNHSLEYVDNCELLGYPFLGVYNGASAFPGLIHPRETYLLNSKYIGYSTDPIINYGGELHISNFTCISTDKSWKEIGMTRKPEGIDSSVGDTYIYSGNYEVQNKEDTLMTIAEEEAGKFILEGGTFKGIIRIAKGQEYRLINKGADLSQCKIIIEE